MCTTTRCSSLLPTTAIFMGEYINARPHTRCSCVVQNKRKCLCTRREKGPLSSQCKVVCLKTIHFFSSFITFLSLFSRQHNNLSLQNRQHGLTEKWYPFEESIMVPLIIQDPRMPHERRGTVSSDFTLSIDLAPTILGAANIEARPFMQGVDIAKLYLDDDDDETTPPSSSSSWRKDFFYEYNRGNHTTGEGHDEKGFIDNSFALVSPEWKYIYWREYRSESSQSTPDSNLW